MSADTTRCRRFWFSSIAYGDLAVCRIVWTLVALRHLATSGMAERVAGAAGLEPSSRVLLLDVLALPFGGAHGLERGELSGILAVTAIAGVLALVGAWTRWSLLAFALGSLTLQAWTYSVAPLRHEIGLLQWSLLLLAWTPCGAAFSVDALRARRSSSVSALPRPGAHAPHAAWIARLVHALLALAYLSAAATKILRGPGAWFGGWTLQYDVAFQALRTGSAAGHWLAGQHALCIALAWLVTAIEVGFAATFFARRAAWLGALAALLLHAGAGAFIGVWFPSFPALCAALIRWSDVLSTLRARAGARGAVRARVT